MLQVAVGDGVNCDGLDVQFPAGAQNSQRDLSAVGDDDFVEHLSLL